MFRILDLLVSAGLSQEEALERACSEGDLMPLGGTLEVIRWRVRSGVLLSEAMGWFPGVFDELVVAMVRAGETAAGDRRGFLPIVHHLEGLEERRRSLRSLWVYPAIVSVIAAIVVLALLVLVIPHFRAMYGSWNLSLGGMTGVTFALSGCAQLCVQRLTAGGWLVILLILVASRRLVPGWSPIRSMGSFLDAAGDLVAPLGRFRDRILEAWFSRRLASLLEAGLGVTEALALLERSSPMPGLQRALWRAWTGIACGISLGTVLRRSGRFTPGLCDMISAGEESGALARLLSGHARNLDRRGHDRILWWRGILEPVVIVMMGIVIGGLIIAVESPHICLINNVG